MIRRAAAVAGAGGIALTIWTAFHASMGLPSRGLVGSTPLNLGLLVAEAAAFLGVGIALTMARPRNLIGPALIYIGLSRLWVQHVGIAIAAEHVPIPTWLSVAVGVLLGPGTNVVVWLIFAFPSGRTTTRAERSVSVFGVVLGAGFSFANAYAEYHPELFAPINRTALFTDSVLAVSVVALVVARIRKASRPERLALYPMWVSTLVLAVVVTSGLVAFFTSLTDTRALVLWSGTMIGFTLIPITYGLGLMRLRFLRRGVGRLVLELSEQPAPGRLRDALAHTLGDPSLELAFWLPDQDAYVGLDGGPFVLPDAEGGRAVAMLERGGERLGALVYDRTLAEAPEVVGMVGAATALALENERLHAAVRAQLEEVRASRQRIVEAADAERRRVERDIHDGAQQRLMKDPSGEA
jgi:signal transduction histidine kinase